MSPQRRRDDGITGAELAEIHRRRARRRRAQQRRKRRASFVGGALLAAVVLAVVTGSVTGAATYRSSCDLDALRPVEIGENSFVYAADGSFLGAIPAERNRQPVALSEMSRWMAKATVAIEDRRFYSHDGVDVEGIARAAWANLEKRRVVQGGSTITQQLVRNLYPVSREQTFLRKGKEACLAIRLDRAWSKRRILAGYLNQVYYGNHAYGVQAAARTYFSKPARSLSLSESALLAGLTQAPSVYDPFNDPTRALARRDEVLRAMLDTGEITRAQYAEVISDRELHLKRGAVYRTIRQPYFFSYVYNELVAQYGGATVQSGGLRVYTTINPRLQVAATKAIKDTLYYKNDPAAALVAIEPSSGAIRAMTAVTPGRAKNQFNLVAQARRQAGSTFKTFVLAAAIEKGVNPTSTSYNSAPFRYQPDPLTEAWEVETYAGDYYGYSSIASATLRSDNTVYAQLTLDLGPEVVAETARKMGVTVPTSEIVPSLGLGAISVSPLEMASAYATLAAGGVYSKPMAIRKVVLPGNKVDEDAGWGDSERKRVLPDWVAYEVTKILEQNMLSGTGTGAYFGRPAAGKTGTTDNHADAWFCGYTPRLQATVWVGYPQAQIPMTSVHGISVAGGTFPADIWRRFMEVAAGDSYVNWSLPKSSPVWRPFDQGQYAVGYSYYDAGSDDSGSYTPPATSTAAQSPTRPRPATPPPVTTVPPVTTAPPPATTTPPPVTTTP